MSRQVETVWRIRDAGGRTTECSIYEEPDGDFTARVSLAGAEVLHVCRVGTMRKARRKAEAWRETLLTLSEFQDCSAADD